MKLVLRRERSFGNTGNRRTGTNHNLKLVYNACKAKEASHLIKRNTDVIQWFERSKTLIIGRSGTVIQAQSRRDRQGGGGGGGVTITPTL